MASNYIEGWNAALDSVIEKLSGTADLYEMYAKHPRHDTDVDTMLGHAASYRDAARQAESLKNPTLPDIITDPSGMSEYYAAVNRG